MQIIHYHEVKEKIESYQILEVFKNVWILCPHPKM
jgi:hypothetical protein